MKYAFGFHCILLCTMSALFPLINQMKVLFIHIHRVICNCLSAILFPFVIDFHFEFSFVCLAIDVYSHTIVSFKSKMFIAKMKWEKVAAISMANCFVDIFGPQVTAYKSYGKCDNAIEWTPMTAEDYVDRYKWRRSWNDVVRWTMTKNYSRFSSFIFLFDLSISISL